MSRFFSCDWGTTSFRLRFVDAVTGEVLAERRDASGIRTLSARCTGGDRAVFAQFLGEQLRRMADENAASLRGASVMVSGMASSSVGWRELPFARVPLNLDGSGILMESFELTLDAASVARIHLVSGIRAEADMMRGEETEILGIFADGRHARIVEDGIVVLPGTHSKHVRLRHRQLTGFRTYMTGELFDVLSAHSLLRASVQTEDGVALSILSEPAAREAFAAGARESSLSALAASLFQTRVRTVLQSVPPPVNRWFLSGLLVGSELADLAAREPDAPVLLAAEAPLNAAYALAFEILGLQKNLTVVPPGEMALASVRGHRLLLAACAEPGFPPKF